ncbi:hypothetical protein GCM10010429_29990 [Micromonospora olivasterospora]|uniref:Integrase-like protein n=1 Tax=Micromonospora olivasterospora TaxID=1880 RepID=A0A562IJY7_MICOL|nr:integrase-like protein [Micromonospora olivasterospora]
MPGHWEGDLIMGTGNQSAIVTLVERATRYLMLGHLPGGHTAEEVRDVLVDLIATLPAHLRGSLTWDQGTEMASHKQFTVATGVPVYFCDPHSHWQRGSNENTDGLLRQYFPKGTDLSVHGPEDLETVRWQPVSPTLMRHLQRHAEERYRHGNGPVAAVPERAANHVPTL